jgi:hypothetical protein
VSFICGDILPSVLPYRSSARQPETLIGARSESKTWVNAGLPTDPPTFAPVNPCIATALRASVDNQIEHLSKSFAIQAGRDILPRVVGRETDRRNRRRLLTISSALSNSRAVRSKERRARRGPAASDGTQVPHEPRRRSRSLNRLFGRKIGRAGA